MKGDKIRYRAGYKYQLAEDYQCLTRIKPAAFILTEYIRLDIDGMLSLKEGYAWDGPSGPTIDTANSMRGSLVHDALYQLLREKLLPAETRKLADDELYTILREDGMSAIRAKLWYYGVEDFAADAADTRNDNPVIVAP